jgi:hypothetical protein
LRRAIGVIRALDGGGKEGKEVKRRPLDEPSRSAKANRGGRSKPRPSKSPNGNGCDIGDEDGYLEALGGAGCSEEYYAVTACKRCGFVSQRCSAHGGMAAALGAYRSHAAGHRHGKLDDDGNPVE